MLSHLRFHRRGPSNPTSPCPDQHTPTSPPASSGSQQPSPFPLDAALSPDSASSFSFQNSAGAARPPSSSSALPPTLPPIPRVTSAETEPPPSLLDPRRDGEMAPLPDSRPQQQQQQPPQQLPRSPYNGGDSGFIGGMALRKYQRDIQAQAAESVDHLRGLGVDEPHPKSRPNLAPINTSGPSRPPVQPLKSTKAVSSFIPPTELQNNSPQGPTGRRPAGTRLTTEPPMLVQTTSNPEVHKAKKGLPFLKNPMSTLLMRRKNSQNVPDLLPLPLRAQNDEPTYDPRIRGTRVHDFSAPRVKKVVNREPAYVPSSTRLPDQDTFTNSFTTQHPNANIPDLQQRHRSNASDSLESSSSRAVRHTLSSTSDQTKFSAERPSPENEDAPPVPPKDNAPIPVQPRPSQVSRLIENADAALLNSASSIRSGRSRNASLSGMSGKDIPSAIPRHMKSTSSRFSFDMIGAAKQEKLLEERHRQRELEKKSEPPAPRDSVYDDYDEDIDYDAMMEDDGFEEEIPMVGEDDMLDEEGFDDPDNDQENFSGFVFQRSDPASALTSPRSAGPQPTPRDGEGNAIGFAMSKDTPGLLSPEMVPPPNLQALLEVQAAGLGIQGLDLVGSTRSMTENETAFQQNQQLPPANMPRKTKDDDLYFDDGMIGFENEFAEDLAAPPEWDEAPFDESIFDNNDTDQFGRPIAGAFAQAQSQRRAANQEAVRRESDMTSRLSAHSAVSQSTAHTSLDVDNHKLAPINGLKDLALESSQDETSETSKLTSPGEDTVAAYQAALAAAAHKAAASGKFQRSSSPPMDETVAPTGCSPTTPDRGGSFQDNDLDDYELGYEDMADFDLDDDAIIAEANASALANDSDGWYGQEFGFYSAPIHQQHGSAAPTTEYEYANGGFFGPKGGLDRSISGRMVSREPNLTPITERSEYSNRNSIMSLSMSGFGPGTPIQSPGLAQLALLGDRGDEMSLSALMRLRNRAWGGSQVSLVSSREGSPRSERGDAPSSPWGPNFFSPTAMHARKNSLFSTFTADSEPGSISGSPTLTMGMQAFTPPPPLPEHGFASDSQEDIKLPPLVAPPTQQQIETTLSPISEPGDMPLSATGVSPLESTKSPDSGLSRMSSRRGHRHKGSADSISYTKEEDSGATRWVMERRRTGETGEVEILEREIVEGGRI